MYPVRSERGPHVRIGGYTSLEECRFATRAFVERPGFDHGIYDCGRYCPHREHDHGLTVVMEKVEYSTHSDMRATAKRRESNELLPGRIKFVKEAVVEAKPYC